MLRARHGLHFSDAVKEGLIKVDAISFKDWFDDFRAWPETATATHFRSGAWWLDGDELSKIRDLAYGEKRILEFGAGGTSHELASTAIESFSTVDHTSHYARYVRETVQGIDKAYYRKNIVLSVREIVEKEDPTLIFIDPLSHFKPRVLRRVLKYAKSGTKVIIHDVMNDHFRGHDTIMPMLRERCRDVEMIKSKGGLAVGFVK